MFSPLGAYNHDLFIALLQRQIDLEGGIDERYVLKERLEDLVDAIQRYLDAGFQPYQEWFDEAEAISIILKSEKKRFVFGCEIKIDEIILS